MLQDLAAFGYSAEQIAKARADMNTAPIAPTAFDIHPANVTAFQAFLAMRTQWDFAALSTMSAAKVIRVGLKYQVLEMTVRLEGLGELSTDDFRRIRVLEGEALTAWSEEKA